MKKTFLSLLAVICALQQPSAQMNLPARFGFNSPPEFDPATMQAIPNLTGQNGLLDIVNGGGAEGSSYFVRFSKLVADGGTTQNALNLKVNLAGHAGKQLELSFYMADDNDETSFYDGVFLSDGTLTKRALGLQPGRWCDGNWGFFRLDLDALIAKHGLSYTSNFTIQFRHEGLQAFDSWASNRDNFYIDEVRVYEAPTVVPAKVPFTEGFASGLAKDPAWYFPPMELNEDGEPTDVMSPYDWAAKVNELASDGDGYSLFLGKWRTCNEKHRNLADIHLNLSGLDNVDLEFSFDFVNWYDDTQYYDGIWLSSDGGKTFQRAIGLKPATWATGVYGRFQAFDLDELIRKLNLSFSADFVIRFQHEGIQSREAGLQGWQMDGLFFDNINVRIVPPVVYKPVPFCDNFDQAGLNLDHWRTGNAQLDPDGEILLGTTPSSSCGLYPIFGNGFQSWHLGKFNDHNGENINTVDLHVNAANALSVSLMFDLYEFAEEFQTEDGIWLSVDGGGTFKKLYDFNWNIIDDQQWRAFQLSLSDLSKALGMTLSDKTIIRFEQRGTTDWEGAFTGSKDGYVIKNVCVNATGISSARESASLSCTLSPNPATDLLLARLDPAAQAEIQRWEVVNTTGQVLRSAIFDQKTEVLEVSVADLPSGVYFLRLHSVKGVWSGKFVKQ